MDLKPGYLNRPNGIISRLPMAMAVHLEGNTENIKTEAQQQTNQEQSYE